MSRALHLAAAALVLTGCATLPKSGSRSARAASAQDCAVMMLAAGFVAEHQPPLHLQRRTRDVEAVMRRRGLAPDAPETWSPDADAATIAALGQARLARREPPQTINCPLKGPSPFVGWRPGRAELMLSNPAYSPAGDFAVIDAAVILPWRRADAYRFVLSGPPKTGWDLHRIEFQSRPERLGR